MNVEECFTGRESRLAASPACPPLRFWLVDDDDDYRELQGRLLQCFDHLLCVGSHPSADAALAELALVAPPDLILMDVNMPGTGGIEAIPLVRALAPEVRVLMNTTFTNPLEERAALAAGASGYLPKLSSPTEWLSAIGAAMSRPVPVPIIGPLTAPTRRGAPRNWLQALQTRLAGMVGV